MLSNGLKLLILLMLLSCGNDFSAGKYVRENEPKEVPILFSVHDDSFPEEWETDEINAQGVDLDSSEMKRSLKVIEKALSKYPDELLGKNLREVYVLHSIKFYGVEYGGTNSTDVVYLSNKGMEQGYDDVFLEKTFHHEFSSVLLRNYPGLINKNKWTELNDFEYFDESGGVNSIKNETDGLEYDPAYLEAGFLYEYAVSCFENDLNSIAENIFFPTKEYRDFLKKYPKIKQKHDMFIAFYAAIDDSFTPAYFEGLGSKE